jgi:hypothetical protein
MQGKHVLFLMYIMYLMYTMHLMYTMYLIYNMHLMYTMCQNTRWELLGVLGVALLCAVHRAISKNKRLTQVQ